MKFLLILLPHILSILSKTTFMTEDEIVHCLKHTTMEWTFEKNPNVNLTFEKQKTVKLNRETSYRKDNISMLYHKTAFLTNLPESFDSREKWPQCKDIINHIRDQGNCAGSWAAITASVFSDRICIGSEGETKVHISAESILDCCNECMLTMDRPCDGGFPYLAWHHIQEYGAVTGGELDSGEGCQPYSEAHFRGDASPCTKSCTNRKYDKTYTNDTYFPELIYLLDESQDQIQKEIMDHGPVMGLMEINEDLAFYKKGLYHPTCGESLGYQAFKIVGWGLRDDELEYWLVANCWGPKWGDSGFFKVWKDVDFRFLQNEVRACRMTPLDLQEFVISNPDAEKFYYAGGKKLLWDRACLLLCILFYFNFYRLIF
ncbi:cathepsin B-like cysteine proteinase 4 [Zophobas morio]|uniref:cathepsin B-like cysteine proteinase 4 n=1 Tax=Zophobas morio TaxID=2755281 RepID=UPI003083C78C